MYEPQETLNANLKASHVHIHFIHIISSYLVLVFGF